MFWGLRGPGEEALSKISANYSRDLLDKMKPILIVPKRIRPAEVFFRVTFDQGLCLRRPPWRGVRIRKPRFYILYQKISGYFLNFYVVPGKKAEQAGQR